MRFPAGAWMPTRGILLIHGCVSRVSLIPNTRLVKVAQSYVLIGTSARSSPPCNVVGIYW